MTRSVNKKAVLFLAQLPPPFHGQSKIAGSVHETLLKHAGAEVFHLWKGGAQSQTDVGKRTLGKYLAFAMMVFTMLALLIRGKRFDVAYLGFAPWAHTATRDAILMVLAKLLANRVWVHVHGAGLQKFLQPKSAKDRFVGLALRNTELVSITKDTHNKGIMSGIFRSVHHVPNFAVDPGITSLKTKKYIHLGIVSNLDPRKGIYEFLASVNRLKLNGRKVRATIVGGTTAELSVEQLKSKVARMGLQKEVTVTGRVNEKEKSHLLRDMDIFLYPSRHDLSPLALIEAIAHGCVPIVLDVGGIPEIVGSNLSNNVLSSDMDEDQFTMEVCDIVETYLANAERLVADGKKAREQFKRCFSHQNFRRNILVALGQPDVHANTETVNTTRIARQETP